MKKLVDRVAFRFGYVPLSVVDAAVDAGEQELQAVKAEKVMAEHVADMAADMTIMAIDRSTAGINARLGEITARIPAVTR